jgi:hypothetical protein
VAELLQHVGVRNEGFHGGARELHEMLLNLENPRINMRDRKI